MRLAVGAALAAIAGIATVVALSAHAAPASAAPTARAANDYVCPDPATPRNPANPLNLPTPPGSNPLNGASFFIDGPAHGQAAGAIAELLGLNPDNFPDNYSWAEFKAKYIDSGPYHDRILSDHGLAYKINNLEKIASEPEPNRLSAFAQGGTPQGLYSQTIKVLCHNLTADPGSIPIINTYFLHPLAGTCPTARQLRAASPRFKGQIDAIARATGNHPAVYLLEVDAIGSSRCLQKVGSLPTWESLLRYEISKIGGLPHVVAYVEGGYSDGNPVGYTAKVLGKAGVHKIRGFWTNDTHLNWTINEINWGKQIAKRDHTHFVINTAQNGNGPKRNPHPTTQGNEDNCNPPGRGLGPPPTTATGYKQVDAFLWSSPPGNSGGSCNGGPPSGTFWAARAIDLGAHANARLGPHFPSKPY
jgi:endoglucanase